MSKLLQSVAETDADDGHTQIRDSNIYQVMRQWHLHWASHEHRQVKEDVAGEKREAQQDAFTNKLCPNSAKVEQCEQNGATGQDNAHQHLEQSLVAFLE
jgi:hypothetical protein